MTTDKTSNQVFDLQRFIRYSKTYFNEQKRSYFWFFAVISMIYFLILLLLAVDMRYKTEMQMTYMYLGLFATGSVFAVRYFASLGKSDSALMTLMQPVSTFEKWLLAFLTIALIYPLIYTIIFEIMTLPMAILSQQAEIIRATTSIHPSTPDIENYQLYVPFVSFRSTDDAEGKSLSIAAYIGYYCLAGYALTASIFFKRLPLIKSIAFGFVLFLVLAILSIAIINKDNGIVLVYLFTLYDDTYQQSMPALFASMMLFIVPTVLMWIASFYALKERDL